MSKALNLDYFYGAEAEQYNFYRIPKILFTDTRFKDVSVDAKVLYGLMLDRMALSVKNAWFDDENRVFIYFTLENAMELLGYGHAKIVKLLSELDTNKGIGLIERKKQGQGKPTIIYVKSFSSLGSEKPTTKKEDRKEYPKPNFKTSENEKSKTNITDENAVPDADNNVSHNGFKGIDEETGNSDTSDISNAEVLTSEIEKSRLLQNGSADFLKTDTNNTKFNKTDISDTQSIYPSISPFAEQASQNKMIDGLMDRISEEDLKYMVMDELIDEQTLPYIYIGDPRKMECAVKILCDYDRYADYAKKEGMNDFRFSTIKLFAEALTEMLTTKENMNLKGSCVTYAKVYDKLIPFINFDSYEPFFLDLPDTVISDFETACKERHIKNHLAYMKSCIWNVLQVGDIGIQALIKKDFG